MTIGSETVNMKRLPSWIRTRLKTDGEYRTVHALLKHSKLHTVCQSAHCPNLHDCFRRRALTFMILGNSCTRHCSFCAVKSGIPQQVDRNEPGKIARFAKELGLRHVVITSVTRDDLPDGGAALFAATIKAVRDLTGATVEVLTPDFQGNRSSLEVVLNARPNVFNHNIETVQRLQPAIRPQADYAQSLKLLRRAAKWQPKIRIKSGIMAGLGETDAEIHETMRDLRRTGCELLTVGQYLSPSRDHLPVDRFVRPAVFEQYGKQALSLGFKAVASGPLVRSSFNAADLLARAEQSKNND